MNQHIYIKRYATKKHPLYGQSKHLYDEFPIRSGWYEVDKDWFDKSKWRDIANIESVSPETSAVIMAEAYDADALNERCWLHYMNCRSSDEVAKASIGELVADMLMIKELLGDEMGGVNAALADRYEKEADALFVLEEQISERLYELLNDEGAESLSVCDSYVYVDMLSVLDTRGLGDIKRTLRTMKHILYMFDAYPDGPAKKTSQSVAEYEHCRKMLDACKKRVYVYLKAKIENGWYLWDDYEYKKRIASM